MHHVLWLEVINEWPSLRIFFMDMLCEFSLWICYVKSIHIPPEKWAIM